ncbi:MAG TPA: ABC transporter permease [Vicinamibacterales bacterium]|nr:ABC transporter permease [Vicinamibacterales bacterium]
MTDFTHTCTPSARAAPFVDGLLFDLRLAIRGLVRDRGFTLAAVAMLAIALALNTTVFAVMDAMLFRGYPGVVRNDRLLYLQERDAAGRCCVAYADFEDWRREAQSFAGLAYVATNRPITMRVGDGRAADLFAIRVSPNAFGLLGVSPVLGRDFVVTDGEPGAPQVALLNHRFWVSRFGARPDIVGTAVEINGAPATIIGVMAEGFDFPMRESLWMPLVPTPELLQRGLSSAGFTVVARLRDGVSREEARAELETINRQLAAAYPTTNRELVPTVASHSETMSGRNARLIWGSTWIAAWFVFLIACGNLANLTMMRTVGQWREFSTRAALGAGHQRLAWQVAIDNVIVAVTAAPIAWWITNWSVRQWAAITASIYQILDYRVDAGTLMYLVAVTVLAVLVMSAAPLVRVWELGRRNALTATTRGATQDPRSRRMAATLIACQMALAVVLLCGAGLLVRSLAAIVGAETGVSDARGVVVGSLRLPSAGYSTAETRRDYFERIEQRLSALPGVARAALASTIPVRYSPPRTFEIDGVSTAHDTAPPVTTVATGPGYFEIVGAPVLSGRDFDVHDGPSSLPVALVNESFATRYFGNASPIGKRIRIGVGDRLGDWRVIVGVVSNILQSDPLRQTFKPIVYVPFGQQPAPQTAYFMLRTTRSPAEIVSSARSEIRGVDADVPLASFGTLADSFAFDRDFMDAEHSELAKHATVARIFGAIALLLAAGGLIAVLAHAVGQRTTEVGVRKAVGATDGHIRRLVVRDGMRPVALGLAAGFGVSVAVARILQSQLVGVSPYDPATFAAVAFTTVAVALLACNVPARRAMRVDPVVALRHE